MALQNHFPGSDAVTAALKLCESLNVCQRQSQSQAENMWLASPDGFQVHASKFVGSLICSIASAPCIPVNSIYA